VPGYVQSLGTASASANVALWTASRSYAQAPRKGTYFRAELAVANGSGPLWVPLTNIALLPGGASADVLSTTAGNLFVPKTPETFGCDADGNLTNDGHWRYTWDAENRLVRMTNYTGVGPQQSLTFEHDWKGRRIHKQVSASGTVTNNVTFVYDGWNPIAQLSATNSNVIRSYVWGLDLSGSEQGAGGVGGLLEVNDTANGVHFAAYDGNGNVAGLVKATDGTTSALYEYGPFGEPLRATGPMAKANPLRFSTKYQDDETDLLYYGNRYLNTSTGKWIGRDPINELGFELVMGRGKEFFLDEEKNLYEFASNDPVSYYDVDGLLVPAPVGVAVRCIVGLALAPAEIPLGATVIGVTVIGGATYAVWKLCFCKPPKKCLPCSPPEGTTMFRTDVVPPSRPHKPFKGTHTHHYVVMQSPVTAPKPCFCWPKETGVTDLASPGPAEQPWVRVGGGGVAP